MDCALEETKSHCGMGGEKNVLSEKELPRVTAFSFKEGQDRRLMCCVHRCENFELLLSDNDTDIFFLSISCRTERGYLLPLEEYRKDTCARCYYYLPSFAFHDSKKLKYEESTGNLVDVVNNKSYEADPEIVGHLAYYTFQSELYARKWIACCRAALDCCSRMLSEPFTEDNVSRIRTPPPPPSGEPSLYNAILKSVTPLPVTTEHLNPLL
ncbi:uncharacterized protein CEXT_46871 [Caerostris extrusa]|uniref:Uncharacterized protein n=1 Tax=Caerostris extrusa TaxID=172846 RepID=A0AAV4RCX4_CAEEX|nr:uncharacterized protein CEXT_46871 [Caerostris extrusa]